jgi:hypothetical protein
MIQNPNEALILGSLNLSEEVPGAEFQLYALGAEHETSWGNPAPVTVVIESLLADGDVEEHVRSGNREGAIGLGIEADDSASLAAAEALLMAELYRRNTLTYVPPDELGEATVYEVVTSSLEYVFDDVNELRLYRAWKVNLSLGPFSRSANDAVVAATGSGVDPSPPTEALVTDANATTGFTSIPGGTTLSMHNTDAVKATLRSGDGVAAIGFDIGSNTDFSATPLLVVDAFQNYTTPTTPKAWISTSSSWAQEQHVPIISAGPSPLGGGYRRYVYNAGAYASSIRRIRLDGDCTKTHSHSGESLRITRIGFSDGQVSYAGTTRQLTRTLEVRGSVRTQASLQLSHTTSNLGDVLVWSGPAGNAIPLRPVRLTGGSVVADDDRVSGAYEDIEPANFVAEVPAAALREGMFALMARMQADASAVRSIPITAQTYIGGVAVGGIYEATASVQVGTSWATVMIDVLPLPTTVTLAPDAVVRISLGAFTSALRLDEAWLFNITEGQLTWIAVTGHKNMWIDPPTLEDPRPRLWAGTSADKSDAFDISASAKSWGDHEFKPGEWVAFTVTSVAENAALSARYPIRWHTHAAE